MQELTTTATLVDYDALAEANAITARIARADLEAAMASEDSSQLWFELGQDEDTRLLTVDLDTAALEQLMRIAGGDDILVAFDSTAITGLFDDEVEAHGLRGALASTIAIAAIAAPAGLASVPQTSEAAATAQRASIAATAQTADLAATAQVSSLAAKAQVSSLAAKAQVSSLAAKAQVARVASKTQVSKQLVVKAAGLKLLQSGLAR